MERINVEYYKNNKIKNVTYKLDIDKILDISYFNNGSIRSEAYYQNGDFHREDGPALIGYYQDGTPQLIEYWINGKKHNPNGPAYTLYYENGNKQYEGYMQNGKYHNLNGPALFNYDEDGTSTDCTYFIHNQQYDTSLEYRMGLINFLFKK